MGIAIDFLLDEDPGYTAPIDKHGRDIHRAVTPCCVDIFIVGLTEMAACFGRKGHFATRESLSDAMLCP